jgi:SSS family solute:Na+ symporter
MISVFFWVVFDFMTVFTGLYALAVLPSIHSSPYLDLAQLVLPPIAHGLFIVSLFAIVMSTVDSFSFISAFTIGKDLTALLNLKQNDKDILKYTRWGLIMTALLSITLAMHFEYAMDIWYVVGSFVVPTLLIPLIAGLYRIKVKYALLLMTMPMIVSVGWYLYGLAHPSADGYPGYIWGLDPMYPGVMLSGILYYKCKKQ